MDTQNATLMSSLPQGWHGIPIPKRNSSSGSVTTPPTVPTTIKKKWNSPLSSEIPRSRLPSYKPSAVRLQRSSINNTIHTRSSSKSSVSQGDSSSSPAKPSPTKELQNEISKLKKELTTVKTENSILKVKVRRVDDENVQKSKQIEKLRVELKAAQKNETTGSKKNKESDLLLLRQKSLRLEGALKEKDLLIKKLTNEISMLKEETGYNNKTAMKKSSDCWEQKQKNQIENKSTGKSSAVHTNLSRVSQSLKGEVSKLRDMIHKLEKENQDLQQQVKDKGDEIRQLKLHLRSRTYIKPPEAAVPKFTSKTSANVAKSSSTLPLKLQEKKVKDIKVLPKSNSSSSSFKAPIKKQIAQNSSKTVSKVTEDKQKKSISSKSGKTLAPAAGKQRAVPRNQVTRINSKALTTNSGSTFVVTNSRKLEPEHIPTVDVNIEDQVIQMRENIAAKKIQRSWRNHRKQNSNEEKSLHVDKAMTFIVTSLKYHKMRKEKLNFVGKQKHVVPNLTEENENAIVEAIRAATKNLWDKEM